jgi:hypothetical protein
MKLRNGVALLALILGLLIPTGARADTVTFLGTTGGSVGGFQIAPYQLKDTAILGGATLNVICDDFGDEVVANETWTGAIETFSAAGVLSPGAMFASLPNSNALYQVAVVLYSNNLNGWTSPAGTSYAIWGLFDPSVISSAAYAATDAAAVLAIVTPTELANFDWTGATTGHAYEVITPTSLGSTGSTPQEYIYQDNLPSPTPEPGTLVLFGSGLLGIVGIVRRKLVNG